MSLQDEIRAWWEEDAATYDNSATHRPRRPAERAAWTAALARLLPATPSRVLDCGAGTGFLSLIAARLGHDVTAVDLSGRMLAKLHQAAALEGLAIKTVEGPADVAPAGRYDVVMERHLLWTLPDPEKALAAWRTAVSAGGRLISVGHMRESPGRARVRGWLHQWQGRAPDHHSQYPDSIRARLQLATASMDPSLSVEIAVRAGWDSPRLERLRDVEWAELLSVSRAERRLGVPPRYAVVAVNR
ncbi:MAG TPA: class I SAM-dependent methyltransferase [Acidimicrobiales bacterium]|jgi:SAM-dependent methyltransferase|nr:class I SAM-dependent methyltransferase [Acidimicrobiales bacterium]